MPFRPRGHRALYRAAWAQLLASSDDVFQDVQQPFLGVAVQLEKLLVVGKLEHVEDEAARVRQRVATNDVHAKRRQHTADVREQKRLVERGGGQGPHRILALDRQVHFVGLNPSRETDVA